jgi:hypothetical protein
MPPEFKPRGAEGATTPEAKRRPLRSNSESVPVPITAAPHELTGQYFTKDFGAYGVFVGTCVGMRVGAHRHTGEDTYCVQYGRFAPACFSVSCMRTACCSRGSAGALVGIFLTRPAVAWMDGSGSGADDGDAEEISLQALQRLIQSSALDPKGKLTAHLARALRTLRSHTARPLPTDYFVRWRAIQTYPAIPGLYR